MSDEEEIPIPKIEDTPIKKKKGRTMTPEMLAKLALAREAAKIAKQKGGSITRMKKDIDIQAKLDKKNDILAKHEAMLKKKEIKDTIVPNEETVIKKELKETVIKKELKKEEDEEDEDKEEKPIKKKKPKKKPIVIVQESSSDSSEEDNVIYIKKKSKKKIQHNKNVEENVEEYLEQYKTAKPPPVVRQPYINPFHQINAFHRYY
jgi:hypothetical protein